MDVPLNTCRLDAHSQILSIKSALWLLLFYSFKLPHSNSILQNITITFQWCLSLSPKQPTSIIMCKSPKGPHDPYMFPPSPANTTKGQQNSSCRRLRLASLKIQPGIYYDLAASSPSQPTTRSRHIKASPELRPYRLLSQLPRISSPK